MGMIFISRANRPVAPQITISALAKIKIPTASARVTPCRPLTNSAAPGVDQAVSTGTFRQALSARVLMPMARPRAVIQPAICPGVAPAAAAACQMMAAELAYPTNTATKPANRVGSGRLNERIDDSHVRYNIHSMYHCAL